LKTPAFAGVFCNILHLGILFLILFLLTKSDMNNQHCIALLLSFCVLTQANAQTRKFNQNSARSNNAKAYSSLPDAWSFGLSNGAAFSLKSNENTLFRGNGFASKFTGQYYFGAIGIGFNSGFTTGKLSTEAIDAFITERKFTGAAVTTGNPFNSYLLAGPSFRLGQRVQLSAEIKGGLFFNQSGSINIALQGATRPLYRFENSGKNLYPGLNGSMSVAYPLTKSSSLMLTTDFLQTSSSVRVFDPQRGIDIPTEQKRKTQLFTAGVSFIKTFELKPRDTQTGQSSGKRNHEVKSPRDTQTGQSSGKIAGDETGGSILHPDQPALIKTKTKSNQSNDRTTQSCGPVTQKTTNPDGTTEEITFACPDDALNYQQRKGDMPNRIAMNVTTPKQTQGATFGEKVNAGLHAAGSALAQGASLRGANVLSGKIIHRSAQSSTGIVSNAAVSSVGNLSGGSASGAAAASYAATGRMANPGATVKLYAREAGSGMATGRRTYQPIFSDGHSQSDICNPCLAVVKNPVYNDKGTSGTNPLNTDKKASDINDEDCDGLAEGLTVYLIDRTSGAAVATTTTNHCGDYWFANVPDGQYTVEVSGSFLSKKGYDYYQAQSQMNVAGEVSAPNETWQHVIYNPDQTETNTAISTIGIIVADKDGDGQIDFFTATGSFADGTSRDLTSKSTVSNTNPKRILISLQELTQKAIINTSRSNIKQIAFSVNNNGTVDQVTALFTDGTTREITSMARLKPHPNVVQMNIAVADVDGDGAADLIWSPKSNLCISAKSASQNKSEIDEAVFTGNPAFVSVMPVAITDVNNDGVPELFIGGNTNNTQQGNGASLLGGALPGGAVISAAMRPGGPIGGIIVKGGKNPGGQMKTVSTNENGEFEFPGLTEGNYTFTVESGYVISDAIDIDLGDDKGTEKKSAPKQTQGATFGEKVNTGLATGSTNQTKVQDHNSSRSNKSSNGIAPDPDNSDSTSNKPGTEISKANVTSLIQTLDELDQQLANDAGSNKAGISTSRSNIRRAREKAAAIQSDLENNRLREAKNKTTDLTVLINTLQLSLNNLGSQYRSISNVLKTKHDTAKNSIGNIR